MADLPPRSTSERRSFTWRGVLRPLLTFTLTVALLLASAFMVNDGTMKADTWFTAWMSIVTSMVSYLFGERAALKQHDEEGRQT